MKKLLIGVVTFLFVAGMVQAEPVKRVDGKRVETYKRITVDTVRGDSTNGIRYDTNRDGADEITMSAAGNLIFEGSTADDFETTVGVVDPTTPDKTINFPDASGTVAVSASAPATLSVLGDIGVTVAGDLATTAPITGAANDIFIGADGTKATIGITVSKDIVAAGTGMSGGEDDVLPGADADVTITLTTAKDIVAGTGLTGGEDNVLPGADADTTLSLDLAAANIWTGAHSFQSASPQLTLGKDETGGTPNIVGGIKVFSAGDNAYYSILTAGTNTSNAAFTLPVDEPAGTYLLNMTTGGQIGYDASTYLTSSTGALVSLSNLASVAINTSLLPASANSVDFGSEALYGRKAYLASDISFEGATDNDYQTTLTAVDPTVADKSINIPNADGTIAVSATAPLSLSALGDISIAQATTSTDGYLVQADWNTFNNKAEANQTMYIGTTGVAINRGTAALTLAGLTLTTPDIGTPSAGTLTNCTFPTLNQNTTGNAATVTTNANLTGGVTSVGNAATVVTNANLTGEVTSVGNAATIADSVGVSSWTLTKSIAATTFELPNGANPTADSAGEIAVDTSAGAGSGLRFYGDATYTLPAYYCKSFVLLDPDADSDYSLMSFPADITIRQIRVLCTGGTNIIGGLDEADVNGGSPVAIDSDITATAGTTATDDGSLTNPGVDANDILQWHTTSISGTPTSVTVTIYFTYDAVN